MYEVMTNAFTTANKRVWTTLPKHSPYGTAVCINPFNGALFSRIEWL